MADEKLVNVELTKSDFQNILNWQALTSINFEVSKEEEILRKRLWITYKKEYGDNNGRPTIND